MQEKITYKSGRMFKTGVTALFTLAVAFISLTSTAQNFCSNETVIWTENFGAGTIVSSNPDISNLSYQSTGPLEDIHYRIANNTQQKPEWHSSLDHTGNINGKMLVVNGDAETFYSRDISNGATGFVPGTYSASLYLMNINTPGTCGPTALLPTFIFEVQYNLNASGNAGWTALQSVTAPSVPQTAQPLWRQLGGVFQLPVQAQRIRLILTDGTIHGCGNDFAIDDIRFATCPSGGPLPVTFSGISAVQKGTGVNISWSTSSESNNKYFDVEKSTDGNVWTKLSSVNAVGFSSTTKNYGAYDARPAAGVNYYRIKQVDNDGLFKYSIVAKVNINIDKTVTSVRTNPFVNVITVDFLSKEAQNVSVRLADITGKVIGTDRWSLSTGTTVKTFDKAANISKGMYILTVMDDNGNVIYNSKLMKQ